MAQYLDGILSDAIQLAQLKEPVLNLLLHIWLLQTTDSDFGSNAGWYRTCRQEQVVATGPAFA